LLESLLKEFSKQNEAGNNYNIEEFREKLKLKKEQVNLSSWEELAEDISFKDVEDIILEKQGYKNKAVVID
jgi:hypothetical protein